MENKIAYSGNKGDTLRSDCFMELQLLESGGMQIEFHSKVDALYGNANRKLCTDILTYFDIPHARLIVEDKGALAFVIMARLEAAIKKLIPTDLEYLPEFLSENSYESEKDQFRFTRLYLPGNSPSMFLNAGLHQPNGVILDLEDSVAPEKKGEAQLLVRNALCQVRFYGAERMVRINQLPRGFNDLKYIVPHNVHVILIPKAEDALQIKELDFEIEKIQRLQEKRNPIYLMPIIETCLGVEKAFEIATSSENIIAMAIGLEDYTADLGAKRTQGAQESFYARSRIVNACKAASIQAIDSVYSDVGNTDGLLANAIESKSLGFQGLGCIHPRQIRIIKQAFAPDSAEIDKAKQIVLAFEEAKKQGLGVVALGSKMIDPPVVKRAEKSIELAIHMGLLSKDWRVES